MPLDSRAVDWIFARMAVRYGSAWDAKWASVPVDLVRQDWARELDGIAHEAIGYALGFLPAEFPPTAAAFREICRRAPERTLPLLPAPKADPERVIAEMSRLRDLVKKRKPLQWAYDLQEREKCGDALTLQQRAGWREALAGPAVDVTGDFRPIDATCLPPAMRPRTYDSFEERT